MNKTSYISSIFFWIFISSYVLLICTFNDAYYICFLPSLTAGVVSAVLLPFTVKSSTNNLKISVFGAIALHTAGVGVSLFLALFTQFAHHFTYLTLKGYLVYIVLPAVLSFAATLVQQYLMFRAKKIKDFLYYHDKLAVALIVVLILVVGAIFIIRPFSKIMVILMPF